MLSKNHVFGWFEGRTHAYINIRNKTFVFICYSCISLVPIKGKVIRSGLSSVGKPVGQTHSLQNSMKLNFLLRCTSCYLTGQNVQ
jgi:hypothetical protein